MRRIIPLGLAAALLAAATPARPCALALLFALDVSASVDGYEYRLQRDGLAEALLDPAVMETVLAQPGGVAFAAYEWSGRYQQEVMLGWALVRTEAELRAVARRLSDAERSYAEFPTAIGYALGYGATLLSDAPACARRVIDISGDGVGNEGFPPSAAYREFPFEGVTVNGLVISGGDAALIDYYRSEVPHGPGAFVEIADGFADYQAAMRRKLLRELQGPQLASGGPERPR